MHTDFFYDLCASVKISVQIIETVGWLDKFSRLGQSILSGVEGCIAPTLTNLYRRAIIAALR
jgi:hypothetical protein